MAPESPLAQRLADVRAALRRDKLDGFLIPFADAFQSDEVPPSDRRLTWLSGFTGSSGLVVVLDNAAAFFTDSRYTLQALAEVPSDLFTHGDLTGETVGAWLGEQAARTEGARGDRPLTVGFDPWLHTPRGLERLRAALKGRPVTLTPVATNPVDTLWTDRPAAPASGVRVHPLIYAGEESSSKRAKLANALRAEGCGATILADATSVAWLVNVRGDDLPHTPVARGFAVAHDDGRVTWFMDSARVPSEVRDHLGPDVTVADPGTFSEALGHVGAKGKPVHVDPSETPVAVATLLRQAGATVVEGKDLCAPLRACKNAVEIAGARAAHVRDGVALVTFFAWMDECLKVGERITEVSAAARLLALRAAQDLNRGASFDTIAGVGPHGAIVHYRPSEATDVPLVPGTLLLLDSGGQYLDGTTDVTRTLALGTPTPAMREHFTRVLKGHIALARVRFPEGTRGGDLDVLARQFLWQAGLDYGHGTGHGVGSYLGVHESPPSISRGGTESLRPGMILSNEPGFYVEGQYGIRIESLQVVTPWPDDAPGRKPTLGFEVLTLVPLDRALMDLALLTPDEVAWVDAYHARVWASLSPLVDAATAAWLRAATAPLGNA